VTKVQKFSKKNIPIKTLYENVKKMLLDEQFRLTKDETTENTCHLRTIKTGVKRIIVGAVRDVELVIAGDANNFAVIFTVGGWGKNLAFSGTLGYVVAVVGGVSTLAYGAIAAAGSFVTAKAYEGDFWKKITDEIERLSQQDEYP